MQSAKEIGRENDENGNPIVQYDKNQVLNTSVYDMILLDESIEKYRDNLIADSICV